MLESYGKIVIGQAPLPYSMYILKFAKRKEEAEKIQKNKDDNIHK